MAQELLTRDKVTKGHLLLNPCSHRPMKCRNHCISRNVTPYKTSGIEITEKIFKKSFSGYTIYCNCGNYQRFNKSTKCKCLNLKLCNSSKSNSKLKNLILVQIESDVFAREYLFAILIQSQHLYFCM